MNSLWRSSGHWHNRFFLLLYIYFLILPCKCSLSTDVNVALLLLAPKDCYVTLLWCAVPSEITSHLLFDAKSNGGRWTAVMLWWALLLRSMKAWTSQLFPRPTPYSARSCWNGWRGAFSVGLEAREAGPDKRVLSVTSSSSHHRDKIQKQVVSQELSCRRQFS